MNTQVQEVFEKYPQASRDNLIPILQDIQEKEGFISQESIIEIGRFLNLATSKIFGVATFYSP